MTPLAHEVAKLLTEKPSKRPPMFQQMADFYREAITDAHFFEVSDIVGLTVEIAERTAGFSAAQCEEFYGPQIFLPAPKTWIEFKNTAEIEMLGMKPFRVAMLCQAMKDGAAKVFYIGHSEDMWISKFIGLIYETSSLMRTATMMKRQQDRIAIQTAMFTKEVASSFGTDIGSIDAERHEIVLLVSAQHFLFCINQPHLVGATVHMAHAGLAKRIRQTFGGSGFPLHGWTEIKLRVTKPVEIDDGEDHQGILTGRRALHFVRKFVRIRRGRVEYVSAHWRGDPSVGIKQSRYAVQP